MSDKLRKVPMNFQAESFEWFGPIYRREPTARLKQQYAMDSRLRGNDEKGQRNDR
jgi:hypothetical protein